LSDKIKENEIDESSDNYEREQKYILGFGFFSRGKGEGEGAGARMRKNTGNTQLDGRILIKY
jgi:hypothetical protein